MSPGATNNGLVALWAVFVVATFVVRSGRRKGPRRPLQQPQGSTKHQAQLPHRHQLPSRRRSRRASRTAGRQLEHAIPDVIDLFAVATAAGLNGRLAVRAVAQRAPPGPIADALRATEHELETTGGRLADALERLPALLGTDAIRPLTAALCDRERYGTALGPTLDRLADDARRVRQRRAEEAARRIPVKLLFPLVTCVLPAFGLLTVAPLIAGGLRALRL